MVYIEGFIEIQHMSPWTYSATSTLLSINNVCWIIIIIHVVNITTKVYEIFCCIPNLSKLVVRSRKGGGWATFWDVAPIMRFPMRFFLLTSEETETFLTFIFVYRMEIDKTRWSCSWDRDQNCTQISAWSLGIIGGLGVKGWWVVGLMPVWYEIDDLCMT